MSTKLLLVRDATSAVTFGVDFAIDQYGGILASNVEQHFTVPSNYAVWEAHFSFQPGSSIWVAHNTTAVLPSSTFGAVNCELNPATRRVYAGDLISMITSDETNDWAGVTLYAIQ
jgi:hypothetical protein